ncbi:hypothetical protein [Azospirillum thermophilum]|uniref:PPM-type phosphatase domain-containing protein n=1 Tax=Azospirillum thermophilum TaxID=2202148 RepID=A0A2S2CP62_9PROT|nr:hypothetical protein [Azospirillum thermophilum]AWK86272.1 hypothetical protein DEW08_08465 [Azospirillum thermophilum]
MLPDHCHRRIDVSAETDVEAARAIAASLAEGLLSEGDAGRFDAALAVVGGHLVAQPGGGTMLVRRFGRRAGMECVAFDRGPGFADSEAAMAEEAGNGFASLRRSVERFAVHAAPGVGTAVLVRVLRPGMTDVVTGDEVIAEGGVVMVTRRGAEYCGDGWFIRPDGVAAVINGTPDDARSAAIARRVETIVSATVPGITSQMVIGAIRRGFANKVDTTVAALRMDGRAVDYTALGTVPAAVVRRTTVTSLSGRWAMVGYNPHVPASVHILWQPGDNVLMSSEGCGRLPTLFLNRDLHEVDPTLAAAILMRDGGQPDHDHTVVVLRNRARLPPETAT